MLAAIAGSGGGDKPLPSNRSFGVVFTAVFLIVAALPMLDGRQPRSWATAVAALFCVLAIAWPRALAPANRVWFHVGRLMHRVVNPFVMAGLFYLVITPAGLVRRLARRGLARSLRPDHAAPTYWHQRGERFTRMDQQF